MPNLLSEQRMEGAGLPFVKGEWDFGDWALERVCC
jgi:hypothetical protein